MRRIFWALGFVAACGHEARVELPPPVHLGELHGGARRPADLTKTKIEALYVVPKAPLGRSALPGIAAEDREVALVELIGALGADGALYINDVLHDDLPAAYDFGKIARSEVVLTSQQGRFDGERRLFTPSEDVLVALDTGYQIDVALAGRREKIVFRPLYDANVYAPYARAGAMPAPMPAGESPQGGFSVSSFDGEGGKSGDDGKNGARGKNGKNAKDRGQNGGNGGRGGDGSDASGEGERGGDGGDGGTGGNGMIGARGGDGENGAYAEHGPSLVLEVRPIYSKFYPDEELIFMEITATYHELASGRAYREEKKRYILHRDQKFVVSSVGGRGGEGGAGGRGGDGGNGGRGGRGGDGGKGSRGREDSSGTGGTGGSGGNGGDGGSGGVGANGGAGANGGEGGRGGDGGEIRADVRGDAAFVRAVRETIELRSVPGEGGDGGAAGFGGNAGAAGAGGDNGRGGEGGDGGRGKSTGAKGQNGKDGKDGSNGNAGESPGSGGRAGKRGERGERRRSAW